jgi:predicted Zn-dependent protease
MLKVIYRSLCSVALAAALVVSAGCATDNTVKLQANQMDTTLKPAEMNDAVLNEYLQSVGNRILAAARELDAQHQGPETHFSSENSQWMFGQNMQFHFVNSKNLNAFTTGGDHMYIYNELFQECKDENELAAVMSHEYAHVYSRHVAKGMNRQMVLQGATLGAAGLGYALGGQVNGAQYASYAAKATGLSGQFFNNGYTRQDEAQADEWGFNFYTRAGWDPKHFGDFFQYMIDKGYDKTPELLSDHPTLKSRVEEAKARAKNLPPSAASWRKPPIANAQRFSELKARANDIARRTPDDKSLANSQQLLAALPRSCIMPIDPPEVVHARRAIVAREQARAQTAAGRQQ